MAEITSYASLTSPATGDVTVAVDISDTSMSPQGTDKQLTMGTLRTFTQLQGLDFLTSGGTITLSTVTSAISSGYTGLYLDPRYVWDASSLVINGIQDFTIESAMNGSIGWTGNIEYNTNGYIKTSTGSPANGIEVYASSPSGTSSTQGIIFRRCVFVGANSTAVVHYGGGQRRCGLVDCLVYNTNSSAGAYAVVVDTALSNNNSENGIFSFAGGGGLAGAYAALGIGTGDQSQHSNDTEWYALATAGGSYSIVKDNGGGHTFYNYYDRSNPSVATVYNHGGGRMLFVGGEDQNTTGLSHLIDASSQTVLETRSVTQAGAGTTCSVSAGSLIFRGYCTFNAAQDLALSGSGTIDMADPAVNASNATILGSAGTVELVRNYSTGSAPVLTSWTGTTVYASDVSDGWAALTPGAGYSNSGSGPSLQYRLVGDSIQLTGDLNAPASGQNAAMGTLPSGVNVTHSQVIPLGDRTSSAAGGLCRVQGSPGVLTFSGVTASHEVTLNGQVYTDA